ncbi:hypothetical protein GOP47_0022479 [Adiantum capillus-veneris]|uniref:Uncharacterized protein n=1 Tax=Adiantum capillus-veneris TaxID=13818 RepID=A0A9D4U5X1_ADICA|nr:hypothetical protein GOP47_0022479 [Adiantum capillus-veneris]
MELHAIAWISSDEVGREAEDAAPCAAVPSRGGKIKTRRTVGINPKPGEGVVSASTKRHAGGISECAPACYAIPIPAVSPNKTRASQRDVISPLHSCLRRRHGVS